MTRRLYRCQSGVVLLHQLGPNGEQRLMFQVSSKNQIGGVSLRDPVGETVETRRNDSECRSVLCCHRQGNAHAHTAIVTIESEAEPLRKRYSGDHSSGRVPLSN
jgi:hypothetical protein